MSKHIADFTDLDSKIEKGMKELRDTIDLRDRGETKVYTNLNSAKFMKDTANLYKNYMLKNEEDNLAFEKDKTNSLSKNLEKLKLKFINIKVSYYFTYNFIKAEYRESGIHIEKKLEKAEAGRKSLLKFN